MMRPKSQELIRVYAISALLVTLGCILWLMLLPAGSSAGILARISAGRLALSAPLVILFVLLGWVSLDLWRNPDRLERWRRSLDVFFSRDSAYGITILLAGLTAIIGMNMFAIGVRASDPFIKSYATRLLPYALWMVLISIQTLVAVRLFRYGKSLKVFQPYQGAFRASLLALGILLLLSVLILWSGIGLKPDKLDWGSPGVPLLPYQVTLALGVTLAGFLLGWLVMWIWAKQRNEGNTLDILICMLLWLGAFWLWRSQPVNPNHFLPTSSPPNQEIYPYSDSATYDLSAQKLLIGIGFEQNVIRPIYSLYLALAQGVSGIGYEQVINWQMPVLALIPALLYLLAKALHHRLSGVLVGLLAILHESNAINLSGVIDVSNSKMIMSDLPTMLGVVTFCLLAIWWLKEPTKNKILPFLAGGVIGVFMLVRTQVIVLAPVFIVLAWFPFRKQPVRWLKNSGVLLAGLLVALAPWMWRNWSLTQTSVLADPESVGILIRYSAVDPESFAHLPGETEEEYISRMRDRAVGNILDHPVETISLFAGHFWNNHIATLLVLPSSFPVLNDLQILPPDPARPGAFWASLQDQCCSPGSYVKRLPYWSGSWQGFFPSSSRIPILVSLLFLAAGLGAAWSRAGIASLVPLLVSAIYAFSTSLVRLSGWRFNLPVDWVGMLFYGIGLVQVGFWLLVFFRNRFVPAAWGLGMRGKRSADEIETPFPWKQAVMLGAVFFMLTATIPLAERSVPDRFEGMSVSDALATLDAQGVLKQAGVDLEDVEALIQADGAGAMIGRAMYPRYYEAGEGLPHGGWPSYEPRDYPRLGFYMIGRESMPVILPVDQSPDYFPNAADVLVIGCLREDYFEAHLVAHLEEPMSVISISSPLWDQCTPQ